METDVATAIKISKRKFVEYFGFRCVGFFFSFNQISFFELVTGTKPAGKATRV